MPSNSTRILEEETSSESGRKTPTDDISPRRSPRNTKLLPAPLSVALSATPPHSKRRSDLNHLNRATQSHHQPSLSIGSIPRGLATTPFHRPKTLILDLDETLIHSTSRPMSLQSSGMGSGSGIVGISLSGLFSGGKHQRGGGGARGEGHVVEVILGGRSTLYHVYKRPYVDHFLKKVSFRTARFPFSLQGSVCRLGFIVVYPRHFHGKYARVCRSGH
jgi:CTD nuclear envelope phosphatase 1